jgi:hypothetical protein
VQKLSVLLLVRGCQSEPTEEPTWRLKLTGSNNLVDRSIRCLRGLGTVLLLIVLLYWVSFKVALRKALEKSREPSNSAELQRPVDFEFYRSRLLMSSGLDLLQVLADGPYKKVEEKKGGGNNLLC